MVLILTIALWYLAAVAVSTVILYIVANSLPHMNDKETIADLKSKLNGQDARIAALEKELADLKKRQYPSFITQSTFLVNIPLDNCSKYAILGT